MKWSVSGDSKRLPDENLLFDKSITTIILSNENINVAAHFIGEGRNAARWSGAALQGLKKAKMPADVWIEISTTAGM